MKFTNAAKIALTILILTGCVSAPVPINYAPSSTKTATGSLSVSDFTYDLKDKYGKPLKSNKIKNTAMGEILIDRDVSKFVRDAVFAELRFVGVKVDDPNRVLKGEIQEFLVDDLGYSVDWTFRVRYVLADGTGRREFYSAVKETKRKTAKFANAFGALNETIKISVEQLLDDPEFVKLVK